MTLHIRQPRPHANIETLVNAAFSKTEPTSIYRDRFKRVLDVTLVIMAATAVLLVLGICARARFHDGHVDWHRLHSLKARRLQNTSTAQPSSTEQRPSTPAV